IMGKKTPLDPTDVDASDPDQLLVSSELIEKWFGLSFDYNFATQSLAMTTTQPLPAEEAYNRKIKGNAGVYGETGAKLPRQEVAYHLLSEPYVDINTNSTWSHAPGLAPTSTDTWTGITQSDVAGFSLQTFTSGNLPTLTSRTVNQQSYFTSVRATMG